MQFFVLVPLVIVTQGESSDPAKQPPAKEPLLVPPMLLKRPELEAGNPLATYAAMVALEPQYRASKPLAKVYAEVRYNFEQFLGDPTAGVNAMSLPGYRIDWKGEARSLPDGFAPEDALTVVEREAKKTRIVVWAEEHHLPQTRSLFEPMLARLWTQGYRYLAAEAFTKRVMEPGFERPDYRSGYYLLDPVFASAVRSAKRLGYQLISYDTSERGPDGDHSFRDRTQAANIKARVFDRDPIGKVLVIAGRGHASETVAQDGWTPMASEVKRTTGIDPFTVYAPTMSQRLTREEEHPWYQEADARGLITRPTIFVRKATGETLGSSSFDAYVFWPRFMVVEGRADWMTLTMRRKPLAIPKAHREGSGWRLVQAFEPSDSNAVIPVDQILLEKPDAPAVLMLPPGKYRVRSIDEKSAAIATTVHQVN
jgi:hypothetical protein